VLISAPIFLYVNIKSVFTTGTHNGVLALLPRKAKIVPAGGASSVNVGFTVTHLTFLKVEELLRLVDEFDEFLVFLLSFVNIS
jgi:hypothetical protein